LGSRAVTRNPEVFFIMRKFKSKNILRAEIPTIKYIDKVFKGVYMLYDDDAIVYIGQSENILKRVHSHKKRMKYDSLNFYIVEEKEDRVRMERELINKHLPKYNEQQIKSAGVGNGLTEFGRKKRFKYLEILFDYYQNNHHGILVELGKKYGVSRERVRQIVIIWEKDKNKILFKNR